MHIVTAYDHDDVILSEKGHELKKLTRQSRRWECNTHYTVFLGKKAVNFSSLRRCISNLFCFFLSSIEYTAINRIAL